MAAGFGSLEPATPELLNVSAALPGNFGPSNPDAHFPSILRGFNFPRLFLDANRFARRRDFDSSGGVSSRAEMARQSLSLSTRERVVLRQVPHARKAARISQIPRLDRGSEDGAHKSLRVFGGQPEAISEDSFSLMPRIPGGSPGRRRRRHPGAGA